MPIVHKSKIRTWIYSSVLTCPVILGVACAGRYWVAANIDSLTPAPQALFHASNPTEGVTIPFRSSKGLIVVQAIIDGKSALCMVDTGSSMMLVGDSDAVRGSPLNRRVSALDGAGRVNTYQKRLLKSVRLGDFEVCNVRGWRVLPPASGAKRPPTSALPILLGNAFFKDTVLTIDYRAHTLLLRPSITKPAATDNTTGDVTLDFTYDGVSSEGWGVPAVAGIIEGQKAHFIVDTGWSLPEMGVSPAVFARISPETKRVPAIRYFVFGNSTVNTIQGVHVNIGSIGLVGPVLESKSLGMGKPITGTLESDAILGSAILQQCRVTIDYPARQIRLSRYR